MSIYPVFSSHHCPYAAVEELRVQQNGNSRSPNNFKDISSKQDEIIKEPSLCSIQNFLFYFPGIVLCNIPNSSSKVPYLCGFGIIYLSSQNVLVCFEALATILKRIVVCLSLSSFFIFSPPVLDSQCCNLLEIKKF